MSAGGEPTVQSQSGFPAPVTGGDLTTRDMLRTFIPVSLSDIIMILSGPILTMGLARLAAPETCLAAYSVSQNVAILLESPITMLLHASTTLTRYRGLFRPLRRLMVVASLLTTVVFAAVAFTPIYDWLFAGVLGQPADVVASARPGFQMLVLWPAAIGWRRFHQGFLINHRQSDRVALAGLVRLGTIALMTYTGVALRIPGGTLAGLVLMVGVLAEAVAVTLLARPSLREGEPDEPPPTWAPRTVPGMAVWYWPLALTQVLVWACRPFINGGIARTVSPEIGLAAWPVAWVTFTIISNSVRAVQQLTLSLLTQRQHYLAIRRFVSKVGLAASGVLALLAFTPLGMGYLKWVLGLRGDLEVVARAVLPALRLTVFFPILVAQQNWLQGLLIRSGQPRRVNVAALAGGVCTLAAVYLGALVWRLPGAILGALSLTAGVMTEIGVLSLASKAERHRWASGGGS